MTLGVRLPEALEKRLSSLAEKTHHTKSYYVKEALEAYLDQNQELLETVAEYREQVKNGTLKTYTLEEIKKRHGLN